MVYIYSNAKLTTSLAAEEKDTLKSTTLYTLKECGKQVWKIKVLKGGIALTDSNNILWTNALLTKVRSPLNIQFQPTSECSMTRENALSRGVVVE